MVDDGSPDLISAGQAALLACRWDEARAHFGSALILGETPEALEGLGQAAWWLDDARVVFSSRERAYELYRARRDAPGAARMAIRLAEDAIIFRAEEAVSNGWLGRARRLLEGLEPLAEHAMLATQEAAFAFLIASDTAATKARAIEAIAVARQVGAFDIEILALALEGLALVAEGAVSDGMSRLDEATTAATGGEMSDHSAIAYACCYMIFACERVRDIDRADQWCRRVQEYCDRRGIRFMFNICRTHHAVVLMAHGRWGEAEGQLVDATEALAATRPGLAADGFARLAELRRRQGRLDEAAAMLEQVAFHPEAQLALGHLALELGDHERAVEWSERVLRQVPAADRTLRSHALELAVRAESLRGSPEAARDHLAALMEIASVVQTPLFGASAALASGCVLAAEGDLSGSRRSFEDAVDAYDRVGCPFEASDARLELARVLSMLGRREEASATVSRAAEAFDALGAAHGLKRAADRRSSIESRSPAGKPDDSTLTSREIEVLAMVADGLSNGEIASRLILSEHTVHRHVANILTKLGVTSRAAAATAGSRLGLV